LALAAKYGRDAESIASAFETMLLGKLFDVSTHALTRQLTKQACYVGQLSRLRGSATSASVSKAGGFEPRSIADAMVVLNADGTCKATTEWAEADRRTAILFWTRAQTARSGTLLGQHIMSMRHLLMTGHGIVQVAVIHYFRNSNFEFDKRNCRRRFSTPKSRGSTPTAGRSCSRRS